LRVDKCQHHSRRQLPAPGPSLSDSRRHLWNGEEAVKAESAERLLLALSVAELPLAFEIVGLLESLKVQVVSRAPDAALLGNQLRAFFPEVSIQAEPEGLRHAWTRGAGETVLVQFGLAREFMLPLTSFRSLDPDPLLPLFGAVSELEPGEAGLVQILFERVQEEWAESVMRAVHSPGGEPFFVDYPELTKAAREKISLPFCAACLRVAAKSVDATGAWRIVLDLASALTHFEEFTAEGRDRLWSPTLRTSRPWRASCIWRWWWMPGVVASWAGRWRRTCTPNWSWTP